MPKDFREFIGLLNSHEVRYLVVGGFAVAFHGHPRAIGDIAILIEPSEANARRGEAVVVAFGLGSLGLTFLDFLKPKTIIQLGYRRTGSTWPARSPVPPSKRPGKAEGSRSWTASP